jgi:hypothetical protein
VDLAPVALRLRHRLAERGGDDPGRLDRPGQDAGEHRIHRVELVRRQQPVPQRLRLRPAEVRQAAARVVAREEALDLGDGLAVADEDESGVGTGIGGHPSTLPHPRPPPHTFGVRAGR